MFKQSHIVLARFIADEIQLEEVQRHKLSLSFGSVLPDLSPRQRTKPHEFTASWEDTKKRIRTLGSMKITDMHSERAVCRQLGMLMHYLADDFTCPHNPSYHINIFKHTFYEGMQAFLLRRYLHSPEAKEEFLFQKYQAAQIHSTTALIIHMEQMHDLYLRQSKHTPSGDCKWIVDVCACAAIALMSMVEKNTEPAEWLYDSVA